MKRTAYLLTVNFFSERAKHPKKLLENIGFDVHIFCAIHYSYTNDDKMRSCLDSHMQIIQNALLRDEEYFYIFEDDINLVEEITLEEITQYEKLTKDYFYLGCCEASVTSFKTEHFINGHQVYNIQGDIRGNHAFCLHKQGAQKILDLYSSNKLTIADGFSKLLKLQVPCVRHDLISPCNSGHKGIFYQDRKKFSSFICTSQAILS